MNKTDLIAATAQRAGLTKKDTEQVIEAALQEIVSALTSGDKVQLTGFGTFETRERAERMGRNLHTGAQTHIPATRVIAFKPSKALKDQVAEQE